MENLPPIPITFTTLIASREFEISYGNKSDKIIIEVGSPINDVKTVTGYDWRCPVKIIYKNRITNRSACGVDSLQALSLAVNQLVKKELESIQENKNGKIKVFGEDYNFEW